jgi:hypothetical protein
MVHTTRYKTENGKTTALENKKNEPEQTPRKKTENAGSEKDGKKEEQ